MLKLSVNVVEANFERGGNAVILGDFGMPKRVLLDCVARFLDEWRRSAGFFWGTELEAFI